MASRKPNLREINSEAEDPVRLLPGNPGNEASSSARMDDDYLSDGKTNTEIRIQRNIKIVGQSMAALYVFSKRAQATTMAESCQTSKETNSDVLDWPESAMESHNSTSQELDSDSSEGQATARKYSKPPSLKSNRQTPEKQESAMESHNSTSQELDSDSTEWQATARKYSKPPSLKSNRQTPEKQATARKYSKPPSLKSNRQTLEKQDRSREVKRTPKIKEIMTLLCNVSEGRKMKAAFRHSGRGAVVAGTMAFVGGLMAGPLGIAVGGAIGGLLGAWMTYGAFEPIPQIIQRLPPEEQQRLYKNIWAIIKNEPWNDIAHLISLVMANGTLQDKIVGVLTDFIITELKGTIQYGN